MKQGKTLTELAQELDRQQKSKRDFVAPCEHLRISAEDNAIAIKQPDQSVSGFAITDHTHRQIGGFTGIPAKYYDRMRAEAPELLQGNVNHWLAESDARRMVRTLDGRARAFLSDRYQRVDNYGIAEQVLPILGGLDLQVESCEVTERRMYIKAVTPRVRGELKVGDEVNAGVVISNSEIGQGAIRVERLIYRLVCLNGMIAGKALSRNHVGRRAEENDELYELMADDTREADDRALLLKVRDVVGAAVSQEAFDREVERFRAAQGDEITGHAVKVVEELSNRFTLNEGESNGVLTHLIQGGDLNRFGVVNAVTRMAQDVESYDRSTELEKVGGEILDLSRKEWSTLAEAA